MREYVCLYLSSCALLTITIKNSKAYVIGREVALLLFRALFGGPRKKGLTLSFN